MKNETLKTIQDLHTTHGSFKDEVIPREDIESIINASVRASNASARQSYSVIVVEDRKKQEELTGYVGSATLIYCVDYTRITDMAEHLNCTFENDPVHAFVTGSTDTILAAQTAVIAARSLGIDSLLTNGIHRGKINRVYELLDLPQRSCFPLVALVIGYADEPHGKAKGRLDGPGIVHWEKYHRTTAEERDNIVARYDSEEENIGLNYNWKNTEISHYLEWFYTKWCRPFDASADHPGEITKQLVKSSFLSPGAKGSLE